ncbi:hypothetical protein K7X08_012162 [Anisodus acutangulus]|uniref:Uncharacterized protein n=1 Tax=Anisodus acutangulus TaxID=402998 RepID=A0A9Q1QYV1_9SOLA|nr:hypothetical protein K7X08_012162 [Anisodus acutangulus]
MQCRKSLSSSSFYLSKELRYRNKITVTCGSTFSHRVWNQLALIVLATVCLDSTSMNSSIVVGYLMHFSDEVSQQEQAPTQPSNPRATFARPAGPPSGDVGSESTSPVNIRGSLGDINGNDQANT